MVYSFLSRPAILDFTTRCTIHEKMADSWYKRIMWHWVLMSTPDAVMLESKTANIKWISVKRWPRFVLWMGFSIHTEETISIIKNGDCITKDARLFQWPDEWSCCCHERFLCEVELTAKNILYKSSLMANYLIVRTLKSNYKGKRSVQIEKVNEKIEKRTKWRKT